MSAPPPRSQPEELDLNQDLPENAILGLCKLSLVFLLPFLLVVCC